MGAPAGSCQLSSGVHLSERISLSDPEAKTTHTPSDSSGTTIINIKRTAQHMSIIKCKYSALMHCVLL